MGSGHVLVYAFDLFMQLYEAEGESPRNAVEYILQKNLYGLDIDKRAFQLSYFALMMKGRQFNRRILTKNIELNIHAISDNFGISEAELQLSHLAFPDNEKGQEDLLTLVEGFKNARDLGSLIEFNGIDFENLKVGLKKETISFVDLAIHSMVSVGEVLQQKYDIGITNPPYMGSAGMNKELTTFVKKYYPDSKSDLFAVFIERLHSMIKPTGYSALITQHAWMFLSRFEKLRIKINQQTIVNMIHLGTRAFEEIGGEVVQTTAFVLTPKKKNNHVGNYLRLVDFPNHKLKEVKALEAINNEKVDYFYQTVQNNYSKVPGMPISFWVSENTFNTFINNDNFEDHYHTRAGMITGNNNLFMRMWHEIGSNKLGLLIPNRQTALETTNKWFPYSKGGEFRRWYGNNEFVVNWEKDGDYMRTLKDKHGKIPAHAFNLDFIFHSQITWSSLSSGSFAARCCTEGFLFDASGSFAVVPEREQLDVLAYLNSKVVGFYLSLLNPTLNFQKGNISALPIIKTTNTNIGEYTKINISISKSEWDSLEKSWDFKKHPLV